MAKYLQIQVKTPCSEKWEHMQPLASGNFCSSCQKTVVDFTSMSDNQLMEYFKKPATHVCGRFYTDQLEKELQLPVKKIPWLKYFFQISLPALLFNYKANAQLLKKNTAPVMLVEKKQLPVHLRGSILINGVITDFSGKPVPGATVMISASDKGTAADSNGIFKIRLDKNERWLEITAVGFEKKSIHVTNTEVDVRLNIATSDNLVLSPVIIKSYCKSVIMGATKVSVRTIYTIFNKNKTDTVAQITPAVELFPNPVKRNGVLTIRWKKPINSDQQITLYNSAGVRLLQKAIITNQPLQQAQLKLDLHAAGYYLIHIVDAKTQNKQVVQFIVQ